MERGGLVFGCRSIFVSYDCYRYNLTVYLQRRICPCTVCINKIISMIINIAPATLKMNIYIDAFCIHEQLTLMHEMHGKMEV